MSALLSQIMDKYQGIAPNRVIHAVEKAAARTGADFSFLMEKASTESSFNPTAKSKSSTATGLFQFIESTWLGMVKEHGAKYGLGKLASQIEMRHGKPCVDDCKVKEAILNLRKNPEISALMAGEFSAQNKDYLEGHTRGDVGAPELYLAHFMGAGGAAKFLNSRDTHGDTVAAKLFPKEARANKNVFFDSASGQPRTLNDVYDFFAQKFKGVTSPAPTVTVATEVASVKSPAVTMTAALSLPEETGKAEEIIWNDTPQYKSGFARSKPPALHKISAENILILAQMQKQGAPMGWVKNSYNS